MDYTQIQKELKGQPILVYDIETKTPMGKPNASKDILKVFGGYSYLHDKYVVMINKDEIRKFIEGHKFFVGFNHMSYDNVVMHNCGFSDLINVKEFGRLVSARFTKAYDIDLMRIIHPKHQARAQAMKIDKGNLGDLLMDFDLDNVTRVIGLVDDEDAKIKDFDYKILNKETPWTMEEIKQIRFYTRRDVEITKKLYEWMEMYFTPLKPFLNKKDVYGKKYLTSPFAVYTYKAICNLLGWEEEYAHTEGKAPTFGGGYVGYPSEESAEGDIYCLDFNSLYPHIMIMCNLYNQKEGGWHGNGVFDVVGYYDTEKLGPIPNLLKRLYGERLIMKAQKDPKEYSIKIILNTCFSDDTDIITENGIKKVKDCVVGEKVYTMNEKTTHLELKPIIETQKYKYTGNMEHIHSNSFDFLVTPDHKMIRKMGFADFKYMTASEIVERKNGRIPKIKHSLYNTKNTFTFKDFIKDDDTVWIKLDDMYSQRRNKNLIYSGDLLMHSFDKYIDWSLSGKYYVQGGMRDMKTPLLQYSGKDLEQLFYFIGMFISEGNLSIVKPKSYENGNNRGTSYRVAISQYKVAKEEIYTKIENCLNQLNFRYTKHERGFRISSKFLYRFLKQFKTHEIDADIPDWVFEYDKRYLVALHDGMYDGDGNKRNYRYNTISEKLSVSFSKLLLMLGYKPRIIKDKPRFVNGKECNPCYRISRRLEGKYSRAKYEKVAYNGYVHCVTVEDNHNVCAGRGGNYNFIGQCYGASGNSAFKNIYNHITASDCTRIGRQWVLLARKYFRDAGYKIIYSDTDSCYIIDHLKDKEKLLAVKNNLINFIKANVPFPCDSFDMGVDDEITHMWFFKGKSKDEKEDKVMDEDDISNKSKSLMKKNYIYIAKVFDNNGKWVDTKVVVKNLGVRQKSTSALGRKIFWEYLVPKIKAEKKVKFTKLYFTNLINKLLSEDIRLAEKRYPVNPVETYANDSIQAQISAKYGAGIHFLIPNSRYGIGKDKKYCTIDEFKEHNLRLSDIDYSVVWSELNYFIEPEKVFDLNHFGM